jgi:hypothetical protein
MTETKTPAALGGQTGEPKLEQVQRAQQSQGKAAPPPVQRPKPGWKPLFRN